MNIKLKSPEEKYLNEIINLLQDISNFRPSYSELEFIFDMFSNQKNAFGIVALDLDADEKLIAFGSLHFSRKIRGGLIGFIEDVVVLKSYRNKGIGKLLINNLIDKAKKEYCYKLVLECRKENQSYYEKLGFNHSGYSMSMIL